MGAFPRVEKYLARLPRGFHSYPECVARASVFKVFTESRSLRHFPWDQAPPEMAALLRTPIQHNAWLPEVQTMSTLLAMADHQRLSDAETVQWFHDANALLLGNRMYRALLSMASPAQFMKAAEARWANFHRGTGIGLFHQGNVAHITLRYPPFLHDELVLRGLGSGLQVALAMSRAKDVKYEIVASTPRSTEYRLSWS